MIFERLLFREVVADARNVAVHQRAGEGEGHRFVPADAHDLDILPELGVLRFHFTRVQRFFNRKDDLFKRIERREAHAARRVIGECDAGGPLSQIQIDELTRARPDHGMQFHMPLGVQGMDVLVQPSAAGFDEYFIHRDADAMYFARRATPQEDLDRLDHPAPIESRLGDAAP